MVKYLYGLIFILVIGSFSGNISGQVYSDTLNQRPKNLAYINAGGGSTDGSIEYERILGFWTRRNFSGTIESFFISGGMGFGSASMEDGEPDKQYMTIPVHVSANFGGRTGFLETGLGATKVIGFPGGKTIPYFNLGYRIEPRRKYKFFFRLNLCIPFGLVEFFRSEDLIFIPLSLSLGISF